MDKKNIELEGPFSDGFGKKCGSCGEKLKEDKEYRRNWNKELYEKTGGKEGRTIYCVPCGERIIAVESKEANEKHKKNQEQGIKDARETIKNCFATISPLAQRLAQEDVAGTIEDYKEIKKVQEKVKKLGKRIIDPSTNQECPFIKGDIENLKKTCQDLINEYISPKDRKVVDNKHVIHSPCCTPRNIKLEENDPEPYYFCDYCWETESPKFLQSLKSYHLDKLNKKMLDNGISTAELNSSSYQSMLTVPDFLLTQAGIKETYQKVEKDLQELLKKKGISIPQQNNSNINSPPVSISNNNPRERETTISLNNPHSALKFPP